MIEHLLGAGCSGTPIVSAVDPPAEDSGSDSSVSEAEMNEAISKHVEPYVPPLSGFVVCRTKAKLRRLHFVGHCGKVPGVHYQEYVHYGDVVPESKDFDWQCIHCFGRGGTTVQAGGRSPSASSGTSSDASSGREEGAEGTKGASAP
jgi:hypothetical protein